MSNLTTEQQFELAKFKQDVAKLGEQEAKELLIKAFKDLIIQQNSFKEILKHHWGI